MYQMWCISHPWLTNPSRVSSSFAVNLAVNVYASGSKIWIKTAFGWTGDKMNQYTGSNFDDFLAEEGILEEVTARAHKRLLALQLQDAMDEVQITKSEVAGRLQTSRSQVDRLLDPDNTAVTLDSLERLARAVGKQLIVRLA